MQVDLRSVFCSTPLRGISRSEGRSPEGSVLGPHGQSSLDSHHAASLPLSCSQTETASVPQRDLPAFLAPSSTFMCGFPFARVAAVPLPVQGKHHSLRVAVSGPTHANEAPWNCSSIASIMSFTTLHIFIFSKVLS